MDKSTYARSRAGVNHEYGYIKVSRHVFDHPLVGAGKHLDAGDNWIVGPWSRFEAWCWMISDACWREQRILDGGRGRELQRGQLQHSLRFMAERWCWSVKRVRTFIKHLQQLDMINVKFERRAGTASQTITLVNYEKYQRTPRDTGTARGTAGAQEGHSRGTKLISKAVKKEDNTLSADADLSVLEAFNSYNALALKLGLPQAATLTPARKQSLKARLKEHGADGWQRALANIQASKFLRGENDRGWRANLDFLLQTSSFGKVIEGAYTGKPNGPRQLGHVGGVVVRDTDESFEQYRARMIAEKKLPPTE